jgi:hypothetical protein
MQGQGARSGGSKEWAARAKRQPPAQQRIGSHGRGGEGDGDSGREEGPSAVLPPVAVAVAAASQVHGWLVVVLFLVVLLVGIISTLIVTSSLYCIYVVGFRVI